MADSNKLRDNLTPYLLIAALILALVSAFNENSKFLLDIAFALIAIFLVSEIYFSLSTGVASFRGVFTAKFSENKIAYGLILLPNILILIFVMYLLVGSIQ